MSLQFVHPSTRALMINRNKLLQKTLRPANLPYSIDREYPILLAPEAHQNSLCAVHADGIVGHINFWPRKLVCKETNQCFPIAFVGNVATDPKFRGQGVMKQLLERTISEAQSLGVSALLLWSDLLEFYQKFGFSSFGSEFRMTFTKESMRNFRRSYSTCHWENRQNLKNTSLEHLMAIRCPTEFSISRGTSEFTKYLSIPDSYLITIRAKDTVSAFAIMGKGYDLVGVIHEWGGDDPEALLSIVAHILDKAALEEITVLTPTGLKMDFARILRSYCHRLEAHPMALVRILNNHNAIAPALERAFIWGLDSI